jgi:hypothetical protein
MLSEEHQRMMLAYLSGLTKSVRFRSLEDVAALSSHDLLQLARKVDDAALGLFVQLLKCTQQGKTLFERLMGDHEEENRPLVDEFFNRYLKAVLSSADESKDYNPLEIYLPPHVFDDLVFVQSRQTFFLRQRIEIINVYLDEVFKQKHDFLPGEQEKAWGYFWDKVMSR